MKSKKIQGKKTRLTRELVREFRDIKELNANETILKQTTNKIVETSNKKIKMLRIRKKYNYLENNISNISDLVFIILGIYLFKINLLTISSFTIIYTYQSSKYSSIIRIQ